MKLQILGFALVVWPVAIVGGPMYQLVDLGSLGGTVAAGYGISANGYVVGGASDAAGNTYAVESVGGNITALARNATAWDVNSSGQVAGTEYRANGAYAVRWQDGNSQTLGTAGSYATAINQSGQVTGMTAQGHAFLTDASGKGMDIGTVPGGTWSAGYDINNAGQVAGYGLLGTTQSAFLWTGGSYELLGTLGGGSSYAMAVDDFGVVAGHAQTAQGWMHAVVWSGGVAHDLGTLGGGNSYAFDINNLGNVVGYSWARNEMHAFLYRDGAMLDLNALAATSGWVLEAAYGMNDKGQIVGEGRLDGQEHVFRLDLIPLIGTAGSLGSGLSSVPEPSTWGTMLAGIAGMLLTVRARRVAL